MIILGQAVDTVAFRSGESAPITVKAGTRVKILNIIGSVATCGLGVGRIGITFNVPAGALYRAAIEKPIGEEPEEDEASGIELVNVPPPKPAKSEAPAEEEIPTDQPDTDLPPEVQKLMEEFGPKDVPVLTPDEEVDDLTSMLQAIEEGRDERAKSLSEQLHLNVGDEPPAESEVGQSVVPDEPMGTIEDLKAMLDADLEKKKSRGEPVSDEDELTFNDEAGRTKATPAAMKYLSGLTYYPQKGEHANRFWFAHFPEKSTITVYDALGPGNFVGGRGREWETMTARGAENIANALLKAERDLAKQPVSEPFGGWLIVPSILYAETPPVLVYKVYDPQSGVKVTKHRVIADKPPYKNFGSNEEAKQWITLVGAPR